MQHVPMQLLLFSTIIFCSVQGLLGVGRLQSVAVSGRLICDGRPAAGVKIKMYEKEFFLDRKMAEVYTDMNGMFVISGRKREITTIDPKVNLYHKCNYGGLCYKKIGITIPDDYITWGYTPERTYDIGTLNLANKYTGTTTDCLN
ncbi:CRE-TTR-20 protein [Caenorhabditis remanei]|uniref:CRE-TTR-20 protein n=1 Tax=Caenorhabditis remanei TaxID=31234 RepID=E3NKT5_CAERE|nr:CRE-TTR-20 protein [Caenorhabditis remanei]